jgi:mono/diheme cytochrome c family protein
MARTLLRLAVLAIVMPGAAFAQDPADFYETNCAACHSIGGGSDAGPDLQGVTTRRDRDWLVRFMLDPEGLVRAGDPLALAIVKQWDGMIMPPTEGLTPALAETLLAYIERQSSAPRPGAGPAHPPGDPDAGRALFLGRRRLQNGGPACAACHAVGDLAGGTLGPDLIAFSTRMPDAAAVGRWLQSPPTPVMRTVYRPAPLTEDESRGLAAAFAGIGPGSSAPSPTPARRLAAAAVPGAALMVLIFGLAWRGRFRAVRRPMIEAARTRLSGGRR